MEEGGHVVFVSPDIHNGVVRFGGGVSRRRMIWSALVGHIWNLVHPALMGYCWKAWKISPMWGICRVGRKTSPSICFQNTFREKMKFVLSQNIFIFWILPLEILQSAQKCSVDQVTINMNVFSRLNSFYVKLRTNEPTKYLINVFI